MYYKSMIERNTQLDKEIQEIEKKLKRFPKGKLISCRNGNSYKWHISEGGKLTYIYKEERALAESLAAKKYLTLLLEDLKDEKRAINFYTRHYKKKPGEAMKLLMNPAYQELLVPYFQLPQELQGWVHAPYKKNEKYPEHLKYESISGNKVRSKSELLIDMILYSNKIPFRYECELSLGETILYPDFTILHPVTKKIYYHEHFGMMDEEYYRNNAINKIQLYINHDILPGDKLIITCESLKHPLDTQTIEKMIKTYFL